MVKLGRSKVITIVIQVLTCWCLFKQAKGLIYNISGSPPYAVKGGSYRFTCNTAGNIPSDIMFIRGSQVVCIIILVGNNCLPTVADNRHQCTCNSNTQQLYINITDVTTADDAVWKCTDNQGGESDNTVYLPVYFGPESVGLNPANIPPVREGGDMTSVTCSATCKPTCLFTWSFGSSVVPSSGGILRLTDINRTQTGMYTCQAKHPVLSIKLTTDLTVTVYYPPRITSLTSSAVDNIIDDKSSVTFTCSSDSRPDSTITWSTSSQTNIGSGTQYSIPVASCQHTDNYTCTANNNIGSPVSKIIPVYVRCSPRLRGGLQSEVTNRVGQTVTLQVDVLAYPEPTFTWKRNSTGIQLYNARMVKHSANNYVSTLQIKLESSSFGVYSVSVINNVGGKLFYTVVIDEATTDSPPVTGSTTSIVVGCIMGFIVGVCVGILVLLIYQKRLNLRGNQKRRILTQQL